MKYKLVKIDKEIEKLENIARKESGRKAVMEQRKINMRQDYLNFLWWLTEELR